MSAIVAQASLELNMLRMDSSVLQSLRGLRKGRAAAPTENALVGSAASRRGRRAGLQILPRILGRICSLEAVEEGRAADPIDNSR